MTHRPFNVLFLCTGNSARSIMAEAIGPLSGAHLNPAVSLGFALRGKQPGLDHLGIQVESKDELGDVYARLRQAGGTVLEQGQTTCCYAKSEKSWIDDPAGISWETFFTTGESTDYGVSVENDPRVAHAKACCVPHTALAAQEASACCTT